MPSSVPTGNAGTLDLQVWLKDQDVAANTSTVYWQLVLSSSYRNTFQNTPKGWSVNIGGVPFSGTFTFNFNNYTSVVIAGVATATLTHGADGTLTTTVSAHIDATGTSSIGGPTDLSAPMTLPPIARASTPSLSGNPADAGASVTIYTNRASTGFTHTLEYYMGTASGTIATGVTDSVAWSIPTSVMNQMPSTTSGGATIRCHTYNGGTYIGYKDIGITINVPASVVPTFTTVTHSEATTTPAVASLVGAYVMAWTKLNVAITGAAGVYGSTIASYKIEVAGQAINAVSGVTDVLGQSGTLTLKGTVTDSRGRTAVKNVSITVLSYAPPAITASSAIRVTSGNAVDPNGTYFRVGITAVTQSLVVGTQKNNLTYVIRMRASNNATAWSSITPAKTATVAATGYSADNVLGTYSVATSYTVRIEITDKLGALAAQEIQVSTGGTLIHLSKTEDGFGVGKYHEGGSIDAQGQMFQNNRKKVLDEDAYTVFRNRNRIINGNFRTNQRGYVSAASLASGAFGFDRWKANAASTTLTFTSAPQGQTITINASHGIQQVVERANIPAGTYVLSWVGTATARVYNVGAAAPAYAASPVVVVLNGAADVTVEFTAVSTSKTVGQVQLEAGSTPTPYELISGSDELMACQRYYMEWAGGYGTSMGIWGFQQSDVVAIGHLTVGVPMRASPTIAFNDLVWTDHTVFESTISGISVTSFSPAISPNFFRFLINMSSFGAARYPGGMYTRNFAGTGRLSLSAEL